MKFTKLTKRNIRKVLTAIADRCDKDDGDAQTYVEELTLMLDELHCNDFFGTEGQLDPRGDHWD